MELAVIVPAAFIIDCFLGDPKWIYHPITAIGKLVSLVEKSLGKFSLKTDRQQFWAGVFLAITVVSVSFIVPFTILRCAELIDIRLKYAIELFWCWQIFAAKSLKKESMRVYAEIEKGDLSMSRKYLSWIVGRDTENLSLKEIIKAVVETVAENCSDGVIAPMIFMFVGGAPLGFLYKAINTLDSMVGYKNEKYMFLGRFSAKIDDIANYIPSRITGIAMVLGSFFTGLDIKNSFRIMKRDRKNHSSPNSGYPESACAGALNIQLSGNAYYFGKLFEKKTIGDDIRPIEALDIVKTNKLMYVASILTLFVSEGVFISVNLLI